MITARLQDAMDIWHQDDGRYPQNSPVGGWLGFWLRVKASICIALNLESREKYDCELVPVWVGPLHVYETWNGPSASWAEVGVDLRWWSWKFSRYQNGI